MDTPNKTRQFFIKYSEFPREAQYYFGSDILHEYIKIIGDKYNIPPNTLSDLLTEIIIADFNFQIIENKIKSDLGIQEIKTKQAIIDILGIIFLPIAGYLKKVDIKKEIEKRGGEVKQYQKYVDGFSEAMEDEALNLTDELIKKHEELVNPEEEKNAATDLFSNNLISILKSGADGAVLNLNGGLVYLLYNKKGFQDEIVKILLSNQEKLTSREFILESKPVAPTVANWLKDFIKQNGSAMFDELALSKYLISSANAKKLDEAERNLLRKLLALYRNLKFFPESLADRPPEEWEIIPVGASKPELSKARTVSGPPKSEEEKRLAELRAMAESYPEGSLERKAIEEEIRKLDRRLR